MHSPSNAAVRPDRDHYFSRIWRVQHQDAKVLPAVALDRKDLPGLLRAIETSPNVHVKKTALRLAQENFPAAPQLAALSRPMGSPALARYEAAATAATPTQRDAILAEFVAATDDWTKSALIAGATENAERLIQAAASRPSPVAASFLRGLIEIADKLPAHDAATSAALTQLIAVPDTIAPALLLAAKTDKSGALAATMDQAVRRLLDDFNAPETPAARRAEIALSLLALPSQRPDALNKIITLLTDATISDAIKTSLLVTLGELPAQESADMLVTAFVRSKSRLVFDQILKNPTTARALIAAVKDNRISPAAFGPGDVARLRTHPNTRVTIEAAAVFAIANPPTPQKDELIAKLLADVQKPGDVAKGRALFAAACAVCHKLGDVGLRDVGPPLAGIGSHGAAELLAHIVDPNRQVEPNYWQWNITTKKGDTATGVIVNENTVSLTLRNQGGA